MIQDIAQIIISYAQPHELENLFIANKLDFDIVFRYDFSKCFVKWIDLEYVIKKFPQVLPIGLALILDNKFEIVRIAELMRMDYLRKIYVRGRWTRMDNLDLLGLKNCKNLRVFCAQYCVLTNTYGIEECTNIKYVDISECVVENTNMPHLKKIKVLGFYSNCNAWKVFKFNTMPKLKHMIICGVSFGITHEPLRGIKTLVVMRNLISDYNCFPNLEFLCIYNSHNPFNNLAGLPKLKHIVLLACYDIDFDISFFNTLTTIRLYKCQNVRNIDKIRNINFQIDDQIVIKCNRDTSFGKYMRLHKYLQAPRAGQ